MNLITKFKSLPGVTKARLYGSLASKKADSYSDIDIEITSNDPRATTSNLLSLLNNIGELYVVLPIAITRTERVYTILWKHLPLYQKLDLKILFTSNFSINKYAIAYDEKFRLFHDFFIGAIRYTKYRMRQMHWASFKFYRSAIDQWLKLKMNNCTLDSFVKMDKINKWIYPSKPQDMDKIMLEIAVDFRKAYKNNKFGEGVVEFMHAELKA